MTEIRSADVELLARFAPLSGMKPDTQASLARKMHVRTLAAGETLFTEGQDDRRCVWLVSGRAGLAVDGVSIGTVCGDTPQARDPLCPESPRRCTAVALEPIEYLSLDCDQLDLLLTWDQTGIYEVADLQDELQAADDGDWMTTLLRNPTLQRLPAANLQGLFQRFQRLPLKAGDVLIRQDDAGDYFYALVAGRCVVTRETPLNRNGIKLAEFGAGDTFGEEALISDAPRSATVMALTDGVAMRLHKRDFLELLGKPLIQRIPHAEAVQRVASGGKMLDVRLPAEYQDLAIDGAVNIPLYFLRLKLQALDPRRQYIVYCGDGRRSAAAAYILKERGFDASVLDRGIRSVDSGLRRAAEA
ncbi:MAG: hypothetical protein RLZZ393_1737 [Pseudomonadota bacterium]